MHCTQIILPLEGGNNQSFLRIYRRGVSYDFIEVTSSNYNNKIHVPRYRKKNDGSEMEAKLDDYQPEDELTVCLFVGKLRYQLSFLVSMSFQRKCQLSLLFFGQYRSSNVSSESILAENKDILNSYNSDLSSNSAP